MATITVVAASRGGQQQPAHLDTLSPQRIQAAALGASESAAAQGASESTAALGASSSTATGPASAEALHTFTVDSGVSRCFFRDCTTVTPLAAPMPVSLADPSGGPVVARASTVLPCPAVPSGALSSLHLPSFSTNLVSNVVLKDALVDIFTPRGQCVSICQVAALSQVFASGQLAASYSCRILSHQTLLWHHRLDHPSLPCLRNMHSCLLISGLPRSLPPLLCSLAPPYLPCVEGRQRATPHSSSFPPTTAPLQTLHMDVWGLAPVHGTDQERYFLLVVDDYTRYTTVFPLRSKGSVRARVRGQGHERYFLLVVDDYSRYTTVFPLRSKDRGGEFSSDLMSAFCHAEGIRQTFTLPASPQQNGIAERRICMVMDVARTSMIHAAAPHFLWPFAVQYVAHQINLQPRVSLPETTPTLRWTGKVGDASVFRVWGCQAFVRDSSVDKLSSLAVPCVFLGFPPDAPRWQFYHPTLRRILSSQDVTFDESLSYYRLFPYRTASLPPPPLFLAPACFAFLDWPCGLLFSPTLPMGVPSRPSRREPLSPKQLREWYARRCRRTAGAGAAGGASGAAGGAAGAGAAGAAGPGGAGAGGIGAVGDPAGVGPARGAGEAGSRGARTRGTGAAGDGVAAGVGAAGARAVAVGGASGAGAIGGTGAGGAAGVVVGDPRAEGTGAISALFGGAARPRPYYVLLLQQVLDLQPSLGPTPLLSPSPVQSQSQLQPASPLPSPSPTSPTRDLTERREPASRPVSPESRSASPVHTVRAGLRFSRPHPPPVPGTHSMTLRPSTAPQRVPLPSPLASSLPDGLDLECDSLRTASPTVTRFLATAATDPLFESTAAFALVAQPVDFAAAYRLNFATSLVAESASASVYPPSVRGECALGTDVLEDRKEELECFAAAVPHLVSMLLAPEGDPDAPDIPTPCSYTEAIEGPYSSQWQAAMDAEMASWKSTGTYVDKVPPPGANIVSGMWIFWGVDFFQTFSPTSKMTTLRVLLHVAAQLDYELHSLDFSTAFLQGSLHREIWLRCPPGFTGSFPAGTQWSLRWPVYGLRQAPREWHDTLRRTLAALGFAPSTADLSLFLRTDTTLPPFYVLVYVDNLVFATADTEALAHVKSELQKRHTCTDLVLQRFGFTYSSPQSTPLPSGHSLSAPPSDESVEPSGPYLELVGCLMYLMTCTRPNLAYSLSLLARYVAPAEIYAGAMAAQELRWLTYLLTDLGEAPRSPSVLYVDNKAMLALCQEHRLEHRTKHIALRYFLARELQQRGQLRLAYVASQANTADVFTKALQPCDHQRFCTVLGLVPTVPHLLTS
ncbi:unnamed protein product [Closterium sp. NIES-53]